MSDSHAQPLSKNEKSRVQSLPVRASFDINTRNLSVKSSNAPIKNQAFRVKSSPKGGNKK